MAAGQCRVDPPTGIAGEIYSGWIACSGTMLGSGVALSGSSIRGMIAAQIESIATAIDNHGAGAHSLGTSNTWALGSGFQSGTGRYSFGAGCPSGSIISITGCDEGGTISFAGGGNTAAGEMFRIHFATLFPSPPAVTFAAADDNAGSLVFLHKINIRSTTTTSGSFGLYSQDAIPSGGGTFSWNAKGFI